MTTETMDEWNARQRQVAEKWKRKSRDLQAALADIKVRVDAPAGELAVNVDAQGRVTGIRLTAQALRHGHERLAEMLLKTIQKSQAAAARQAEEAARPFTSDPDVAATITAIRELTSSD
jgi:DNA-binding protein YbaB